MPDIDYDALAKEHGGTPAVDYDALAAQHGGTLQGQPAIAPSEGGVLSGAWGSIKGAVQGAAQLADPRHTAEAVASMIAGHAQQVLKAKDAYDKKNYTEAFGHLLAAAIPGIGPAAAHAGETIGGTEPTYDKFGNVVTPGTAPNPAKGIGEGAVLVGTAMAPDIVPPVAKAVGDVTGKVVDAIPTRAGAGQTFQDVMGAAKDVPVDIRQPAAIALRIEQLGDRGSYVPPVVKKFLSRLRDGTGDPVKYGESRDFYSNATALSADDAKNISPVMGAEIGKFTAALKQAEQDAAASVGKGADYLDAMREYHNAARNAAIAGQVGRIALKAIIPAGIGAGAVKTIGDLMKK